MGDALEARIARAGMKTTNEAEDAEAIEGQD